MYLDVIFVCSVRFNGQNLARILSMIFYGNKGLKRHQENLKEFDDDVVDKKFQSFCKKINTGYSPITDSNMYKRD